jgi:hypothetical protein
MIRFRKPNFLYCIEVLSKPHIAPKYKAWADEKTEQPWAYVSILRRITTQ